MNEHELLQMLRDHLEIEVGYCSTDPDDETRSITVMFMGQDVVECEL